jgi:hypothetical protein
MGRKVTIVKNCLAHIEFYRDWLGGLVEIYYGDQASGSEDIGESGLFGLITIYNIGILSDIYISGGAEYLRRHT